MRPATLTLAAFALLAVPATAREARIKLPAGLAERTERLDLTGIGGARTGTLALGTSSGEFTRQADRLGIVDPLYAKNYGGSAFRLTGPEAGGDLTASCRFSRTQSSLGPITLTPKRLRYSCTFERDGKPIDARLDLQDRDGTLGSADGLEAREGTIRFEGTELKFTSLHTPEGSLFAVPHPLGYLFQDASGPVAAVDLNGNSKRLHLPKDPKARAAALAASLALAVFWDPALVDPKL
jgi:hypothetical protein